MIYLHIKSLSADTTQKQTIGRDWFETIPFAEYSTTIQPE
jgi:hypothetical protein